MCQNAIPRRGSQTIAVVSPRRGTHGNPIRRQRACQPSRPRIRCSWFGVSGRQVGPENVLPGKRAVSSLSTRACAWHRRAALDDQLASGIDPSSTPELATRAHRLTRRKALHRAAASLDAVVDRAEACGAAPQPPLPLRTRAVLHARAGLLGLAQRLRDDDAVGARAAAITNRLLAADDSPLYTDPGGDAIWDMARLASAEIDDERRRPRRADHLGVRHRAVAAPAAR